MSAFDAPLEQRPKVFKAVGVNVSVDVFDCMIDNAVKVLFRQSDISRQRIRRNLGARFDMVADDRTQRLSPYVGNDLRNNLAAILFIAALKNSKHASLAIAAGIFSNFSLANLL